MPVEVKVEGLPDYRAALLSIPSKLRKRALRNALAAGARVIQKAARGATPVLREFMKAPYRRPGTVRKAISVRTSRLARRRGNVGVFVNVRPAKAGQRGAKSPIDPYYWRWLNFGTKFMRPFGFLEKGADQLGAALEVFKAKIGPQIEKLNRKGESL